MKYSKLLLMIAVITYMWVGSLTDATARTTPLPHISTVVKEEPVIDSLRIYDRCIGLAATINHPIKAVAMLIHNVSDEKEIRPGIEAYAYSIRLKDEFESETLREDLYLVTEATGKKYYLGINNSGQSQRFGKETKKMKQKEFIKLGQEYSTKTFQIIGYDGDLFTEPGYSESAWQSVYRMNSDKGIYTVSIFVH